MKYEYRILGPNSVGLPFLTSEQEAIERLGRINAYYGKYGNVHTLVRREVLDWEEVDVSND